MMESPAPVPRPASAGLDPRRWWALALLCGAFFMVLLDGTITIVALPSIGADRGLSKQDLAWVLSAYALTFGGLLLLGGRAADLLGRRRVFMAGVLFFTAASLAGVAGHESGLASGLSNTALQIGTALGVAIVSTVAVSRSQHYLAAHKGASPLAALTDGYRSAFVACAVLAVLAPAVGLPLPPRPRQTAHHLAQPPAR